MRVLVLSSMFPSDTAPIEGVGLKEQLNEIKKLCPIVGVISPAPWMLALKKLRGKYADKSRWGKEKRNDIKVCRPRYFMIPKFTIYLNGLFYFISVYLFLLRKKRDFMNFDIIHVHFAYPAGFAGALLGKALKKRVVLSVRGSDINYFLRDPILKVLIKYALKRVDRIIAVSNALKKKVSDLGINENKISVIPNGINLDLFKPIPKKIARERLGLDSDSKVILFIGTFEKVKGLKYLLAAFKEVCCSNIVCKPMLVLVGTGSLDNAINSMIRDYGITAHVLIKKYVPHDNVPVWINACDVFCLTSMNEGRPNVLYEAISCGKPVVATNVGGVSEILVSNELGEMVSAGSVNGIRDALVRTLKKTWNARVIRSYALSHSMKKYSEIIVNVYRNISEPITN